MKFARRQFLHLASGAATLPALSRIARAQTYPTRPVRIVVGFAPGGVADIATRLRLRTPRLTGRRLHRAKTGREHLQQILGPEAAASGILVK